MHDSHSRPTATCAKISDLAASSDTQDGDLTAEVRLLRQAGWLTNCLPKDRGGAGWGTEPEGTLPAFEALRELGQASLPTARLFEGHMNAVKLILLYAAGSARREMIEQIANGSLFGVWGADKIGYPVQVKNDNTIKTVEGIKRFASGLGLVDCAIVTVAGDGGTLLTLLPTEDAARADPSGWTMAGMRATQSGSYDFSGMAVLPDMIVGQANDYFSEPHFEGGIWRYCAAHLGGADALFACFSTALRESGRQDDPHQLDRLANAAMAIETARLWIRRAAFQVEAPNAASNKAAVSLFARDVTERSCRDVIQLVEQGLGMAAHVEGSTVERIRRDLGLFLCQAAPDAKRRRAACELIKGGSRVEDL